MADGLEIAIQNLTAASGAPGVLVVGHSSKLAGAELCLLDIVRAFDAGSSIFLFENGPLRDELLGRGFVVTVSKELNSFGAIKRDRSLMYALSHVRGLVRVMMEMIDLARGHSVIYANSQKAFVLASVAALVTRRPLVWHLHDILSPAHFGWTQRRLVVLLANLFATKVIVPSAAAATAFRKSGGRHSFVHVIPNGLDLREEPLGSFELRSELKLPGGFLFGVFSRIGAWKGQHIAIAALARIQAAHCVIVGGPMFGEHAYFEELHLLARRLGVLDRVTFLGHRNDVDRLMRAVDVVVHPSVAAEPFGRTIVEAMLCRTPIVAARNGAIPEILEDGRAGILVPAADAEALARALRRVMDQPGAIRQTVEHAYFRARRLYTSSRMVAEVRDVVAPLTRNGART
jgi:glycosyltransferase involved in cell wall biosynthesis